MVGKGGWGGGGGGGGEGNTRLQYSTVQCMQCMHDARSEVRMRTLKFTVPRDRQMKSWILAKLCTQVIGYVGRAEIRLPLLCLALFVY